MQLGFAVSIHRLGIGAHIRPRNVSNTVHTQMDVSTTIGWKVMNPNLAKKAEIVFCCHQTRRKQEVDMAILDQFAAPQNAVSDT